MIARRAVSSTRTPLRPGHLARIGWGWLGVAGFALIGTVLATAEPVPVSISGGGDFSAHNYAWTVTNNHGSPIVFVAFPHYQAGMLTAPEGWEVDCTGLVKVGAKDVSGICTALVKSSTSGIGLGRSGEFRMQIGPRGAIRGRGDVVVRFADGLEHVVAGVELPRQETGTEKNLPLFGLAAMLVVVVIVHRIRSRSNSSKSASSSNQFAR